MTSPFTDYEAWSAHRRAAAAEHRGGPSYGALQAAQRLLQDRLSGAVLPAELVPEVTDRLHSLADLLAQYQAPETQRWDGWRADLPGRGLLMLPPYIVDE